MDQGAVSAAVMIGRRAEQARLARVVQAAARGAGSALVVTGEAGIGKSALLAACARHATGAGVRTVTVTGRPSESMLALAGLDQVLRALRDRVPRLPAMLRAHLQELAEPAPRAGVERLGLCTAVHRLLTAPGADEPTLLVLDDAHWLDQASLDVLAFAAHRLEGEHTGILLGWRTPAPRLPDLPEFNLLPLPNPEIEQLLDMLAHPPRGAARRLVREQAAGNPLALIELAGAIAAEPGSGRRWAGEPVALADRLQAIYTARLESLPPACREALLVAAAGDDPGTALDSPIRAALSPAEANGLVTLTRTGVVFTHPLARAAVYHAASFPERAAVHTRLAQALTAQPDRRAWHLAAAADGPDEQVAALLEASTQHARRRGGAGACAAALERAAELSPHSDRRAARFVAAAEAAVATGHADRVADLAERALSATDDAHLRRSAERAVGWELMWSARHEAALAQLLRVARQEVAADPGAGHDTLSLAATVCYQSGSVHGAQAVHTLLRALRPKAVDGVDHLDLARLWAYACTDPVAHRTGALALLERLRGADLPALSLATVGAAAWLLDETEEAVTYSRAALEMLRAPGARGASGAALSSAGSAYLDAGRLDQALENAFEAADLAAAYGMGIVAASADLLIADVAAMRGRPETVSARVQAALARVDPASSLSVKARAYHASGLSAFAHGNAVAAYGLLRRLFDSDGTRLHPHVSLLAVADLAAAAVRAGRRLEARILLGTIDTALPASRSPRLEMLMHRAKGLLAEPAAAGAHFAAGLADARGGQWPFAHAQLQLDYGEWLRRARKINDAKDRLLQAREAFDRLGAAPWLERTDAELRACGVSGSAAGTHAPAKTRAASVDLTPQQLRIIDLAAQGLSNQEIGARLHISPRTVGSHLYRVYPKLGVTGRHQLRAALDGRDPPARPDAVG